jgi:hypothetical protein
VLLMAKSTIKPSDLGAALAEQLGLYGEEVVEAVNAAGEKAAKALVRITKKTAPKRTGGYRKSITYTAKEKSATGDKEFTWGAKAPHHRLTHLLVKGHPTGNGGRTTGDPFLQNALETVLPEYEKEVEEALKK